ncbi:O-antigen acetylase [Paraconexibacter sp. AEG42_29]|uniref:O-antigen acetylase n=1 Tax=Paraconexibacter sp. AEG42_29 TaxID=2997339 RepID=A0AAU7AV46_9ACTN
MRVLAALRLCACLVLIAGVAWLITAQLIDATREDTSPSAPTVIAVDTTPAPGTPSTAAPPPPGAGAVPSVTTAPPPRPETTTVTPPPPSVPTTSATAPLEATAPLPAPVANPTGLRCFGAAAMDPARPCRNLRLAGTVFPTPQGAADAQRIEPCRRTFVRDLLRICFWGVTARAATRTIAIVGDSHASHWRAAMQRVVEAKRWRVISISRAGCPLTAAYPNLPGLRRKVECRRWNREVVAYLKARPSITAVFTGAHLGSVIPARGLSMEATRRGGYARVWRRLLIGGVRHIVVFRDTPRISGRTLRCVEQAMSQGSSPGDGCALARDYALRPDPMVQAAPRLNGAVQVADLSRFFCEREVCRPVIGGALVLRDVSHMTTTYSASLAPYLQAAVNDITRGWTDGRVPGT